jgi:hypothetical protein
MFPTRYVDSHKEMLSAEKALFYRVGHRNVSQNSLNPTGIVPIPRFFRRIPLSERIGWRHYTCGGDGADNKGTQCKFCADPLYCGGGGGGTGETNAPRSKKRKKNPVDQASDQHCQDLPLLTRLRSLPTLQVLAMRSVVLHYRRPSQFERQLPVALAKEVWNHLPADFLCAQRMARIYHANKGSDCACPRELWFQGNRIIRQIITTCVQCCGGRFGSRSTTNKKGSGGGADRIASLYRRGERSTTSKAQLCPQCGGAFGKCGCAHMMHAIITIDYNSQGYMRHISLRMNRYAWPTVLGEADLIGEGYLHGLLSWKLPSHSAIGAPFDFRIPPDVSFYCGIRVSEAMVMKYPAACPRNVIVFNWTPELLPCVQRMKKKEFHLRREIQPPRPTVDNDDSHRPVSTHEAPSSHTTTTTTTTRNQDGAGDEAYSAPFFEATIACVSESALGVVNRTNRAGVVGSHVFDMVNKHTNSSRTVEVFRIAAGIYLESCAKDYYSMVDTGFDPLDSRTHTGSFIPSYRQNVGTNIPKSPIIIPHS